MYTTKCDSVYMTIYDATFLLVYQDTDNVTVLYDVQVITL